MLYSKYKTLGAGTRHYPAVERTPTSFISVLKIYKFLSELYLNTISLLLIEASMTTRLLSHVYKIYCFWTKISSPERLCNALVLPHLDYCSIAPIQSQHNSRILTLMQGQSSAPPSTSATPAALGNTLTHCRFSTRHYGLPVAVYMPLRGPPR